MQFECPSRFGILSTKRIHSIFMKKEKNPDTFAVINNYNFYDRHTDIPTQQIYDRPSPEGQVVEDFDCGTLRHAIWAAVGLW